MKRRGWRMFALRSTPWFADRVFTAFQRRAVNA
jgi:hypothetical protein